MPTPRTFISAFYAMAMFALPIAGALAWAFQHEMLPETGLPLGDQHLSLIVAAMMLPAFVVFLPVLPVILLYPTMTPWVYIASYATFGLVLGDGVIQSLALAMISAIFGYLFVRSENNRVDGIFMELQR